MQKVTTYYLEMLSASFLNGKSNSNGLIVAQCEVKQYRFNKFLYSFIGEQWCWTDKLTWSDDQWISYVDNEKLKTFVAFSGGSIAGYFELLRSNNDVEIIYFGLAEEFIGKGHGGYLLTEAIQASWAWEGVERVWVHTCTLDHHSALQNYISRGMEIYKQETSHE